MTELLEATFVPEPDPEDDEEQEKIHIRCSVFFDGTLNNRTNIEQRLVSADADTLTDEEKVTADELTNDMSEEEIIAAKGIYKKRSGVGSYENGFTNVVKLERYALTDPTEKYEIALVSYIEGAGTQDRGGDKLRGYAIGTGPTGVWKKVEKGMTDVVSQVKRNHVDKSTKIEKFTLDVFGFSRGAATARTFIFQALLDADSVKQNLTNLGYEVGETEVWFAGLYDTVSSHGLSFNNDTGALKLDAVAHARDALHLAAADEHRENFSLTDIKSAKTGIQIFLPGVHSDVGGSYREGASEDHDVYWTMGADALDKANREKEDLVAAGWYEESEITLDQSYLGRRDTLQVNLHAKRSGISNLYSRIPLHLMAKYARLSEVSIDTKLEQIENIPSQLQSVKQEVEAYVSSHEGKGAFSSKPEDWHDNGRSWLRDLRHDYFHFSARLEIGNGPRFIDHKRGRHYLDG